MSRIIVAFIVSLSFFTALAVAQPTSFTYQGSLTDNGGLADGIYDFVFDLFDGAAGGASLGTSTALTINVVGGTFSVQLDFGASAFNGSDRFLEISTRFNGEPTFTTLAPRVPIDSVPYATFAAKANVANFANAGPFEPVDNTPKSSSGFIQNESFVIIDFSINGQNQNQSDPRVQFPIEITRNIGFPPFNPPQVGEYDTFSIDIYRQADFNDSSWRDALHSNAPTELVLTMILQHPSTDQTEYNFLNTGVISNYSIGYDPDIGTTEVLTIQYPTFPFNLILTDLVRRTSTGYTPVGHGGEAPSFGGNKAFPGTMTYQWNGVAQDFSNAGVLPHETNPFPGNPAPQGTDMAPVVLLHHAIVDFRNSMFNDFDTQNGSNSSIVRMTDPGGSVLWTSQSPGIISKWSLNQAEDGGLFEAYTIEFAPAP